jgi:hypothetical protein
MGGDRKRKKTLQTKQQNVMTQHTPLSSETQSADAMLRARAWLVEALQAASHGFKAVCELEARSNR